MDPVEADMVNEFEVKARAQFVKRFGRPPVDLPTPYVSKTLTVGRIAEIIAGEVGDASGTRALNAAIALARAANERWYPVDTAAHVITADTLVDLVVSGHTDRICATCKKAITGVGVTNTVRDVGSHEVHEVPPFLGEVNMTRRFCDEACAALADTADYDVDSYELLSR